MGTFQECGSADGGRRILWPYERCQATGEPCRFIPVLGILFQLDEPFECFHRIFTAFHGRSQSLAGFV
jgi:hypothetical protein